MKTISLFAVLLATFAQLGWACTPISYVDESGHELPLEQIVEIKFTKSAYVVVGDVVDLEDVVEHEPTKRGRMRTHTFQRATVVVRKSWKPSKAAGDKLLVYTDLNESCGRSLVLGSQALIYASGDEPVGLNGWGTILEEGFSAVDVRILDELSTDQDKAQQSVQPNRREDAAPG